MEDRETTEKQLHQSAFRKLSFVERPYFGMPANVVIVAKIQGRITDQEIADSLKKILAKYPIIGTRIEIDRAGNCWLIPANLPKLPLKIVDERNGEQWTQIAEAEQRHVFNLETGPLIRFTLMRSYDKTTLIVSCHHSICDGLSACFLLSDLLHFVAEPNSELGPISDPTLSADEVIPLKSAGNLLQRIGVWSINRKWKKSGVSFNFKDYRRLFDEYWRRNPGNRVVAVDLDSDELQVLIQNCKKHQVTVNTALVTAMLAVQIEQRGERAIKSRVIIPVNIREKYDLKVEKTFGFFALVNRVDCNYDKTLGFWENARKLQKLMALKIGDEKLSRTSRLQMIRQISPSLVDSLQFAKFGLLDNPTSNSLLKRLSFSETISSIIVTNLGVLNIPETYGWLKIDSIYGPCVFATSTEKVVGVATVNNKLTITVNYNDEKIDSNEADQFLKAVVSYLNCTAAKICSKKT